MTAEEKVDYVQPDARLLPGGDMTTYTRAVERAAELLIHEAETTGLITDDVKRGLDIALDVEEMTETLAREQWNRLSLVAAGEMPTWEATGASLGRFGDVERQSFRDRVRPFADAIRRSILGEAP